ncbi:MAG: NADH-quinone oxidoreductase subunit M [Thermoflexales bacterium]|nr:NADH-quinone oxidoreductase subunit M [Thermoflexales bacterium]MDW8293476.1 NADH-quinone oxidoreductase subunit M [Anaerolineae bacterium]
MLSLLTFLPLLGALVVVLAPRASARWIALTTALLTFFTSLVVLLRFDPAAAGYQFVDSLAWVPQYGISYKLGLDGISLWLVLLTTFIFPIALWFSGDAIHQRERAYYALMLLMETAALGVFLALDLFLFYVFWEFALVPMYFIIGVWGGERRLYAAIKFFIYTMVGSVLMLVAILVLGINAGTFDLELIAQRNEAFRGDLLLFAAFALAFAIKVPTFPLHTWLPDAHVEAPTPGSVILASVLLKMGSYGLIRYNLGLFPEASAMLAPLMMALGVIGILYGAMVAFAQNDAKKLIAYSSVSHMGFVVLGIFALNPIGVQGALLQMVNHGLSTGGLFLAIGMLYERRHTRDMRLFGGLWARMPVLGTLTLMLVLASVGLPTLNGFVGEFTILQGAFLRDPLMSGLAALGMVLSAAYLLTMFQKIFLGASRDPSNEALRDVNWREALSIVPLIVMCFVIGLYAAPFFELMEASVAALFQSAGMAMK